MKSFYVVIFRNSANELSKEISIALNMGFKLAGGASITHNPVDGALEIAQALIHVTQEHREVPRNVIGYVKEHSG